MELESARPRVLLYSTLIGHPWGGSEKYWYDAACSPEVVDGLDFDILISRSAVAEERAKALAQLGHSVRWRTPIVLPLTRRLGRGVLRRLGREPVNLELEQWGRWLAYHRPQLLMLALSSTVNYSDLLTPTALAQELGIPYWIVVQHSYEHFFPNSDEEADGFRATFRGARRVIFVAKRNRQSVERVIGESMPNAWMSTNTLDREFLLSAAALVPSGGDGPPDVPRLLNLARFEPDIKGQHVLLEALSGSEWEQREWRLALVGGGRQAAALARLLTYYGLGGRVELVDHREDVLKTIAEADLTVMPSLSEGTPYALLETMAAGLPAVGTPVGGIPEVIQDGRTGWLAAAAEVAPFAQALERAWTDMPYWPEFGRRAAESIRADYCSDDALRHLGAALRHDLGRPDGVR